MSILIYGGSFNPPHAGHVRSAQVAAGALKPEKVLFIPASLPPHKELAAGSPASEHRLAMAALAAKEVPGGEAIDLELHRAGLSYTSDTLRILREQYPGEELIFLLGTDMLLTIDTWHEPEVILSLATVAVFAREMSRRPELEAKAAELKERYGATVSILDGEPVTVSSTEIRNLLPQRQGRDLLPGAVYAYIIRHRLYGAKPDFDWLRERAYAWLKPKRVAHVQGTEQEARRLARRWDEDESDAAEAAIVHDITKKLSRDEQLRLADKYGIILDVCERENEKLLHSKTGSAFATDLFGLPEHIAQAVRWHTTGKPDMTVLEQIIYLADYIEPGRSGFPGLEELRRTAYEDLDAAMELALRMSLAEVREKGQEPHENTARAHDWYLARIREKGVEPVQYDSTQI